jgi:phosphatidate phosphatase APP1
LPCVRLGLLELLAVRSVIYPTIITTRTYTRPPYPLACLRLDLSPERYLGSKATLAPQFWSRFFQRLQRPHQQGRIPFLRYLFPNVHAEAKRKLDYLRYNRFPNLRHRAQASIYRYLVARQLRKQKRKVSGFLGRLRTPREVRRSIRAPKDAAAVQSKDKMAFNGSGGTGYADLSAFRSEGKEPGARRKKLAGYLKAANDLRSSYWAGDTATSKVGDEAHDNPFPDASIVKHGNAEMILFPSYARKHIKTKVKVSFNIEIKPDFAYVDHLPQEPVSDDSSNDEDFWRRQWDNHEADKAIVDVDVRGWIYNPQRGPHGRKHRLMIGVARQVVGLPSSAANKSADSSAPSSRTSSPTRPTAQEEDLIQFEAEKLVKEGNAEAERAQRGDYHDHSNNRGRQLPDSIGRSQTANASYDTLNHITPLQKRSSWAQPANMTAAELATANGHLLTRLKPFLASGLAEQPVSAFFYNESISRQRTVYTDASGHFNVRAPLDFIPTHVRVLAGEGFSATEEVNVTTDRGVSLISDIDDTIKHSNINGGAREIFRNAFIRDLGDLTIDGVREWYNTLHDMGVKIHYVSNAPWQVYPVLSTYFKMANLPRGSFHLKQYSGALQGIFEPVAERKKGTLDRLMRDFPERKFILVGDSGEADLEVYTEVVLGNPGRILGVFIRDVTTPVQSGYFDPNGGSGSGKNSKPGSRSHSRHHSRTQSGDSLAMSKRLSRPDDIREDDADFKAAVAASLQDMEEEMRQVRKNINPDAHRQSRAQDDGRTGRPGLPDRMATSPGGPWKRSNSPEEDLIDFSDTVHVPKRPQMYLSPSDGNLATRRAQGSSEPHRHTPAPPPKPQSLRRPSNGSTNTESGKAPPPRPRKPSTTVKPPSPQPPVPNTQPSKHSPLSQVTRSVSSPKQPPPLPTRRGLGKRTETKPEVSPVPGSWQSDNIPYGKPPSKLNQRSNFDPAFEPSSSSSTRPLAPPPPPRRVGSTLSFTTSSRKNRDSGAWSEDGMPASPGDGMGKKEFLWQQRWARSKAIMDRNGVTLRTWRVGSDIADVCIRLAEMEIREMEKEEEKEERGRGKR